METNDYFCADEWKDFLKPPMFKVVFSEEVISFLQTLDEKARRKLLFRVLIFGNSAQSMQSSPIGFLLFGIRKNQLWS